MVLWSSFGGHGFKVSSTTHAAKLSKTLIKNNVFGFRSKGLRGPGGHLGWFPGDVEGHVEHAKLEIGGLELPCWKRYSRKAKSASSK